MFDALQPAAFYGRSDDKLSCRLCPHACSLATGQTGLCSVRKNIGGTVYALNYGQISALALDPIEKKPLRRFKSGSKILSVGSWGCNLGCRFCQNWQIAKALPQVYSLTPEQLVDFAWQEVANGNIGLAYTYNEPLVCYEFVRACCVLATKAGLDNVLVSNGYVNEQPLRELAPLLKAANIDLKCFTDSVYRDICGGSLEAVKNSIKLLHEYCHVEITTLVLPGINDSDEEVEALAKWLASIDRNIPYHLARYFPHYQMSVPATSVERILSLQKTAGKYLHYVYTGNL